MTCNFVRRSSGLCATLQKIQWSVSFFNEMPNCRKCFVKRGWLVIKKEMRGRFASPEMQRAAGWWTKAKVSAPLSGVFPSVGRSYGHLSPMSPMVTCLSSFLGGAVSEKYVRSCGTVVVHFFRGSAVQQLYGVTIVMLVLK